MSETPKPLQEQTEPQEKKKRLKHVEIGQTFNPFKEIALPSQVNNYRDETINLTSFRFKGVKIEFKLSSIADEIEADEEKETPLGKVKRVTYFVKEKGEVLEQTPLNFSITAEITSLSQYKLLEKTGIKLSMGDTKLLLSLSEKYDEWEIHERLKKDKSILDDLEPGNGIFHERWLLPWDESKLATIEAKIVQKSPENTL